MTERRKPGQFRPQPLTMAERGRLGGLMAAHRAGSEGMSTRGRKGGRATLERHGRAHYLRIAYRRHGRLKDQEKENLR